MGYGLKIFNPSGALVLSSDGYLYGYVGQAAFGSITPPGTSTVLSFGGYSTYTIDWPGQILVALPIKTNGGTALVEMSQSGITWTIKVHKANGSTTSLGFNVQEATEVYVFGAPTAVSGYGGALYNAAGALAADLGRHPLMFDRYVSFAANILTAPLSGMTTPAIIGAQPIYTTESVFTGVGATPWINRVIVGAWRWDSAFGQLNRVNRQQEYSEDDGGIAVGSSKPSATAILIEAATLP